VWSNSKLRKDLLVNSSCVEYAIRELSLESKESRGWNLRHLESSVSPKRSVLCWAGLAITILGLESKTGEVKSMFILCKMLKLFLIIL
jgi:hypothetical protein